MNSKVILISLLVLFFAFGVWGSLSESLQLSFIAKNTKDLISFAKITELEKSTHRKLVNDVLWYPVKASDGIFLGDTLQTGKDASLSLDLLQFAKAKIRISGETLVQMRISRDKPMLMLMGGEIDITGDSKDQIYVSSGLETRTIKIEKDQTTRVKKTDDGSLDVRVSKTELHNDQGVKEIGQSNDKWVNTKNDAEEPENIQVQRPLKYPYPVENTVFLQSAAGEVILFPAESCNIGCKLRILKDSKDTVAEVSFKAGETVVYHFKFDKSTSAAFAWYFEDGGQPSHGVFFVRPFSNPEMKKAMEQKFPIEVMSGL